jgi:3-polyprenyl-4-hydroxybenzoate decarboxylase
LHRRSAIYPATVVGKPRQEDYYIGEYLQELLAPLFPIVMPAIKSLWSFGETGFHALSAAVVHERYFRESMAAAFRILGEGQLSLTKFLLLTDQPVDVKNFTQVLTTILERCEPESDLFIFANLSLDTLDYTGPALNKGSRGILLGTGPAKRLLATSFSGDLPEGISAAKAYCPGCLVLQGKPQTNYDTLLNHPAFEKWPLLILVDDLHKATRNEAAFLWTVFTRFEPAADIHARNRGVFRHHLRYQFPLLIDACMKPSYPPEVLCDSATAERVTRRWHEYFPQGQEMGDSESGHVS